MIDQQILTYWYISLIVAAVVVVIAAALLIAVLSVAKNIERGAGVGLETVKRIRENTQIIWALQDTNQVALQLADGAMSILNHAGQIAQALHDADVRQGRAR
ncbi:MAG: hypothetical protein HZB51_24740 [Chloroflexi bacterium]|nr:hypothetical protein [Chloroflexota bacterium]